MAKHELSERELATVLASLRFWQSDGRNRTEILNEIACDGGRHDPMSFIEIDELCHRLNWSTD